MAAGQAARLVAQRVICDGQRPDGRWPGGGSREAPMATNAAEQVAAPAGWPGVLAPVLASKITAPGVPGWAVQRPRITKLTAEGRRRCPLTVVTGPPGAGKTMALAL